MSLEGLGETIWIDRSVAAVRGSVRARVIGVQGDRAPIYSARTWLGEIKPGMATSLFGNGLHFGQFRRREVVAASFHDQVKGREGLWRWIDFQAEARLSVFRAEVGVCSALCAESCSSCGVPFSFFF